MKAYLSILLICGSLAARGEKERPVGVFYFSQTMGHVHQFASINSPGLTTIVCGQPLQSYPQTSPNDKKGWRRVKAAGVAGYVQSQYLRPKRPSCFQSRYPKFFDALELSATESYYWARLPDLYVRGKSQVGR